MPHQPNTISAMAERETWPALHKGWLGKCPACGGAPMMQGYLTVRHSCPSCGEGLHHHRADDGPAYLTILIVGHLMAPLLMWVFTTFHPEPAVLIAIFSTFAVVTSLYLLPRIKGAMVALQWAKRMHGFGAPAESHHADGDNQDLHVIGQDVA